MRVPTIRKQFDFALTEKQYQTTFIVEKYQALAFSSPKGLLLSDAVEADWSTWLKIVEGAPWLRHWNRFDSRAFPIGTPQGKVAQGDRFYQAIGLQIYVNAVWGFGVDSWFDAPLFPANRSQLGPKSGYVNVTQPLVELLKLQGVHCIGDARNNLWDNKILIGMGRYIPIEFGDLDRWLQQKWTDLG